MINQRKIALDALVDIEKNVSYSNIVLRNMFSDNSIKAADRPFISALFYGVLDRKITLDYVISQFTVKPVKNITPVTLCSLRLAVYQIMYMDKVPASAAVNESVALVKNSKERYNSSFVNAVLRNFLRKGVALPDDNSANALCIRYSCPVWIVDSLINDYGIDTAIGVLNHYLTVPDITVRVNTTLISNVEFRKQIENDNVTLAETVLTHAYSFSGGTDVKSLTSYKNGYFYVQDIPSQIAVTKLNIKAGERVLDMCAAPGGKTFFAAITSENKANITSCDVYENRLSLIKSGAERLQLKNIDYLLCDSRIYSEGDKYDVVICDVPCSGLGVIRRKPEIKYKTEIDLVELKSTQTAILDNAVKYLKTGGRILYSTCTLRRAENESIVGACLDKYGNFALEYEHTFLPDTDKTDGFYCAVLKSR